jgi:hypothetical protein
MALTGFAVSIQEGRIESVVDLEDGKMLEIFSDALHREGLLREGFSSDGVCPPCNFVLVSLGGIDLPDPSSVPVARRAQKNFRVEMAELEAFHISKGLMHVIEGLFHGFSLWGESIALLASSPTPCLVLTRSIVSRTSCGRISVDPQDHFLYTFFEKKATFYHKRTGNAWGSCRRRDAT